MSGMIHGFDATTPQLKFVKRFVEAYCTLDLKNVGPFLSKHYKYQSFPKVDELPDHGKDHHVENFGKLFTAMSSVEYTFHEVIEAPGKVVLQWTALCTTPKGTTVEYESVAFITLEVEGGELKVLEYKEFSNPEKRREFHEALTGV